jgi:hypothetical protein
MHVEDNVAQRRIDARAGRLRGLLKGGIVLHQFLLPEQPWMEFGY